MCWGKKFPHFLRPSTLSGRLSPHLSVACQFHWQTGASPLVVTLTSSTKTSKIRCSMLVLSGRHQLDHISRRDIFFFFLVPSFWIEVFCCCWCWSACMPSAVVCNFFSNDKVFPSSFLSLGTFFFRPCATSEVTASSRKSCFFYLAFQFSRK